MSVVGALVRTGFLAVFVAVVIGFTVGGRPVLAAQTAPASPGWLEIDVPTRRPEATPEAMAEGKRIYNFRCSACHGVTGEGDGPVAQFLDPRPRNFTFANFKFRTTKFSELALDEDLFRTITRGVPGTAMPSWITLRTDERWKVVYYIKTFAEDFFSDPDFDPRRKDDEGDDYVIEIPSFSASTPELVEAGKKVFVRAGCVECHGKEGRGDGTSAGRQFNYLKQRILPRDLSKGWTYKGGSRVEDIWRTLTSGLNGTPMPSFIGSFDNEDPKQDERDRIAVAHYIRSLAVDEGASEETLLKVRKVEGPIPADPRDQIWEGANEIRFRMFGQVTRRPRWQTPSVDHVSVRALYNDSEIAIRLVYHDRTENTEHRDADIVAEDTTYPVLDVTDYEHNRVRFRDATAVEFPVKPQEGAKRPYFLYGQIDNPVNLWRYRADRAGEKAFEELSAKGPEKISVQPETDQALSGGVYFEDGRRQVVIKRSLTTPSARTDVQFEPGRYIPFVVMAWDGDVGESGLRHSLSSWYNLVLEAPIPERAYGLGLAGFVLMAVIELLLLRRARSRHV